MTERSSPASTLSLPSNREIVMTRVISAPRTLVFAAFTDCEHLKHWLGPRIRHARLRDGRPARRRVACCPS